MKMMFLIFLCLSSCAFVNAQVPSESEEIVQRIVDAGFVDGHDQKVLGQMGDGAAVLVTKVLAGRNLTPKTIDIVLEVLYESFADPRFVQNENDRKPRTAMLVLKYFDLTTNDVPTKKNIAEARKFLQERTNSQ